MEKQETYVNDYDSSQRCEDSRVIEASSVETNKEKHCQVLASNDIFLTDSDSFESHENLPDGQSTLVENVMDKSCKILEASNTCATAFEPVIRSDILTADSCSEACHIIMERQDEILVEPIPSPHKLTNIESRSIQASTNKSCKASETMGSVVISSESILRNKNLKNTDSELVEAALKTFYEELETSDTTVTDRELITWNENLKISEAGSFNVTSETSQNCEERRSTESPGITMLDFKANGKYASIQKERCPTKILLVLDDRDFYQQTEKLKDVKVVKTMKLSFNNAISFLEKHEMLGKGSLIIICCGISSIVKVNILDICKRSKCPNPVLKYSIISSVTSYKLVSKALKLQEYILNNTICDQVMFCELVPLNISCDLRKCGNNHYYQNAIHNDILEKYLKTIEEYNKFVTEHSESMDFKSIELLKHLFPTLKGNAFSFDCLNVLDEEGKNNVSIYISDYMKELLRNMKSHWKKQSEVFDFIDSPLFDESVVVDNNTSADKSAPCDASSDLCQDKEHLQKSSEVDKPFESELASENLKESTSATWPTDDRYDQSINFTSSTDTKIMVSENPNSVDDKGELLVYNETEELQSGIACKNSDNAYDGTATDGTVSINPIACAQLSKLPFTEINIEDNICNRTAPKSKNFATNEKIWETEKDSRSNECSNSFKVFSVEDTRSISNISQSLKSNSIPGIAYIIALKDLKHNKISISFDCVLCNPSSEERLGRAEIKIHIRTKMHLLNVMEVDHHEMFIKYKDDETVASIVLYKAICKGKRSSDTRIIATSTNYNRIRLILGKTIAQLRKPRPIQSEKSTLRSSVNVKGKISIPVASNSYNDDIAASEHQGKKTAVSKNRERSACEIVLQQRKERAEKDKEPTPSGSVNVHDKETIPVVTSSHNKDIRSINTTAFSKNRIKNSSNFERILRKNLMNREREDINKRGKKKNKKKKKNKQNQLCPKQNQPFPFVSPMAYLKLCQNQPSHASFSPEDYLQFYSKIYNQNQLQYSVFFPPKEYHPTGPDICQNQLGPSVSSSKEYLPTGPEICQNQLDPSVSFFSKEFHPTYSKICQPLVDMPSAEGATFSAHANVQKDNVFQKVVFITFEHYFEYMEEFRLPLVEVVIMPSSCNSMASFIKSEVKNNPPNTLWLTHSGLFNIARITSSDLCLNLPCDYPLDIVLPYDESLINSEKFLFDIHHYVAALTEEVIAVLRPSSAFLILPPMPPTLLKIEKSLHSIYHRTKQNRFYYSTEEGCRQLKTLFTALSKEITMLAILYADKQTLPIRDIEDYFYQTRTLECHINLMTFKDFDSSNKTLLNLQLYSWYEYIRNFIFRCVNMKCTTSPYSVATSLPGDVSVASLSLLDNASTSYSVLNDTSFLSNVPSSSHSLLVNPPISNTLQSDGNSLQATFTSTTNNSTAENNLDFTNCDHVVFLGFKEELNLLPKEARWTKYISQLEINDLDWKNIKQKLDSMNLASYEHILFAFIGSIKLLCRPKSRRNHAICQEESCENYLQYSPSEGFRKRLIRNALDSIRELRLLIEAHFKKCKFLLLPLFPIYISSHTDIRTLDQHRKAHELMTKGNLPWLVDGSSGDWIDLVEKFKYGWSSFLRFCVRNTGSKVRELILQHFIEPPMIWCNIDKANPVENVKASFTIRRCKFFLRLLISRVCSSAIFQPTFRMPHTIFGLLIIGDITPEEVSTLTFERLNEYYKEYQRICEVKKNFHFKLNSKYGNQQLSNIILDIMNYRDLNKKAFYNFSYVISNEKLEPTRENVENVQYLCHEFSEFLEGDCERLLKRLGNIRTNSVCILVFKISLFTQEASASPSCSKFNCDKAISVLNLPIQNIGSNSDSVVLKAFILKRISNIMTFVSKLSTYIPVVILPFFPARIYNDEGFSYTQHKLGHLLTMSDTYVVIGSMELWEMYTSAIRNIWLEYLKLCFEKYFVSEKLLNYIEENLRFFVMEKSLQKFSLEFIEISNWSSVFHALLDVLVKNTKMPIGEVPDLSAATGRIQSSKENEIIVVDLDSDSSQSRNNRLKSRSKKSQSKFCMKLKKNKKSSLLSSDVATAFRSESLSPSPEKSPSRSSKDTGKRHISKSPSRSCSKSPSTKRRRSVSGDKNVSITTRDSKSPFGLVFTNETFRTVKETLSDKRSCSSFDVKNTRKKLKHTNLSPETELQSNSSCVQLDHRVTTESAAITVQESSLPDELRLLGLDMYQEHLQERAKLMLKHREEYDNYYKTPELHSSYEIYYGDFCSEYMDVLANSKGGPQDWEKLWKDFWNNKIKIVEQQEWKRKEDELFKNFELKVKISGPQNDNMKSHSSEVSIDKIISQPSEALVCNRIDLPSLDGNEKQPLKAKPSLLDKRKENVRKQDWKEKKELLLNLKLKMKILESQKDEPTLRSSEVLHNPDNCKRSLNIETSQVTSFSMTSSASSDLPSSARSSPTTKPLFNTMLVSSSKSNRTSSSLRASELYSSKTSESFASSIPVGTNTVYPIAEKDYISFPPSTGSVVVKPSTSYTVDTNPSNIKSDFLIHRIAGEFSIVGALSLLEQISCKLGLLGQTMLSLSKSVKDMGPTSKEVVTLLSEEENRLVLQLVINKLQNLIPSTPKAERSILFKTLDWTVKLMDYGRRQTKSEVTLDVNALAVVSLNKTPQLILGIIKRAFASGGKTDPTEEEINEVFLKICSVQLELAGDKK